MCKWDVLSTGRYPQIVVRILKSRNCIFLGQSIVKEYSFASYRERSFARKIKRHREKKKETAMRRYKSIIFVRVHRTYYSALFGSMRNGDSRKTTQMLDLGGESASIVRNHVSRVQLARA